MKAPQKIIDEALQAVTEGQVAPEEMAKLFEQHGYEPPIEITRYLDVQKADNSTFAKVAGGIQSASNFITGGVSKLGQATAGRLFGGAAWVGGRAAEGFGAPEGTAARAYEEAKRMGSPQKAVGGVVGLAGQAIGGTVGAIGTPIANAIKGQPLLQDLGKNVAETAASTGDLGERSGEGGVNAFISSKVFGGKILSGALSAPTAYAAYRSYKGGDMANAGLYAGLAALGLYGASKQPTLLPPYAQNLLVNPRTQEVLRRGMSDGKSPESLAQRSKEMAGQSRSIKNSPYQNSPQSLAADKADEALEIMDDVRKDAGQMKSDVLKEFGSTKVSGINAAKDAFKSGMDDLGYKLTKQGWVPKDAASGALTQQDLRFVNNTVWPRMSALKDGSSALQVSQTTDVIEDTVYQGIKTNEYMPSSKIDGLVKSTVGVMNTSLKSALSNTDYNLAVDTYSGVIDTLRNMARRIGPDGVNGPNLIASYGKDQSIDLFTKVKDLTGIDLIREAQLADDVRVNAGLVKPVPMSPGGDTAFGFVKSLAIKALEAGNIRSHAGQELIRQFINSEAFKNAINTALQTATQNAPFALPGVTPPVPKSK